MDGTRLNSLKARLAAYQAAEVSILEGAQSYQIGSRRLQRGDLAEIRAAIADLERQVAAETNRLAGRGRIRTFGVVPRDM